MFYTHNHGLTSECTQLALELFISLLLSNMYSPTPCRMQIKRLLKTRLGLLLWQIWTDLNSSFSIAFFRYSFHCINVQFFNFLCCDFLFIANGVWPLRNKGLLTYLWRNKADHFASNLFLHYTSWNLTDYRNSQNTVVVRVECRSRTAIRRWSRLER